MRWLINWRWWLRQKLAQPGRYYGSAGTIHQAGYVDVETVGDRVRASEMFRMYREHPVPEIVGVEVIDRHG